MNSHGYIAQCKDPLTMGWTQWGMSMTYWAFRQRNLLGVAQVIKSVPSLQKLIWNIHSHCYSVEKLNKIMLDIKRLEMAKIYWDQFILRKVWTTLARNVKLAI